MSKIDRDVRRSAICQKLGWRFQLSEHQNWIERSYWSRLPSEERGQIQKEMLDAVKSAGKEIEEVPETVEEKWKEIEKQMENVDREPSLDKWRWTPIWRGNRFGYERIQYFASFGCELCKGKSHRPAGCPVFPKRYEKYARILELKLCLTCIKPKSSQHRCPRRICHQCGQGHLALLFHDDKRENKSVEIPVS
ncbi:unnamed protein product [Caenorhabditis angaria]|uniref:Uncharacterized protein n=1 Tax=Caenorhabditis angaria TaxID=860376 RepID=A0A9P1N4K7_9PELO|nr:unnamed protein product [Caenorhabditis angaria]